jgi:transcriptional regulator with XRE-family HTH domain
MKIILKERIKELRQKKNYIQKVFAEKLGIISVNYLHYEKDQREPPLALLADIAVFYGVSVDYFLGLKDI